MLLDAQIYQRIHKRHDINLLLAERHIQYVANRYNSPLFLVLDNTIYINDTLYGGVGYIAGKDNGIVTVANKPAQRAVWLMSIPHKRIIRQVWSSPDGRYLFKQLDASQRYLVMCRDLPPNGSDQRYEPVVWDYVEPATDLTIAEQQAMWQKWSDEAYAQLVTR